MLNNYSIDKYGVVHQIERSEFCYNPQYVASRYNSLGTTNLTYIMSHLRLGYIYGAIGSVSSLLDVGFGNGAFLSVASSTIKKLGGADVFDNPFLPIGCLKVNDITNDHWDVITFFDSLEHYPTLDFVKNLNCNYIVVSLPWCHYPNDDDWFLNWKHRRPDEHLHHFNDKSLTNFFESCGFQLVTLSNIEDTIRKSQQLEPNILTAIFKNTKF